MEHLVIGKQRMGSSKTEIIIKKDKVKYTTSDIVRFVLAIAVVVVSACLFITLSSLITDSLQDVEKVSPEPRNFTVPIRINLNGTRSYDVDVSFALDFTYQNGTLIVDDAVEIDGIAVLLSNNAKEIETIQVGFQNALAYNTTTKSVIRDYWGVPEQGYLFFNTSQSGIIYPFSLTEKITVIWTIDGNYHPIIGITYKNGTQPSPMFIEDIVITVFPKEQLTQVQTAEVNTKLSMVNTWLSIAVFVFSIFNIITIVIDILPLERVQFSLVPQNKDIEELNQKESDEEKSDTQEPQEQPLNTEQEPPQEEKE